MRTVDSEHEHEHEHAQPDRASDTPARLPRRIARKATSSATPPDRITLADPPWAFANAVNAGIHAPIARKAAGAELAADAGSLLSTAATSSGNALPATIQRKFEDSLGADLSGVRVHTGDTSAQAASAISARAYTTGQDIHFAAGQYDPASPAGEHLLAHEVAHTVQQGGGGGGDPQCKLEVSSPGDHCEVEADRAADAMVSGSAFRVGGGGGVQRAIMRTPGDEETTSEPAREGGGDTARTEGGGDTARTGGGETATDGSGTGGSGTTTDGGTVATRWRINYDRIYGGAGRSGRGAPGERSESSVLHVREFRVQPERDEVTPATPFAGYHLQNSGAVEMGTLQHPRGAGGEASASISYMRDRDFRLSVTGGDARQLRALGGRAAIARRLSGELTRQGGLPDDLAAAATALMTEQERAAGVTVSVRPAPGSHETTVTPIPLRYAPITAAATMDVMVEVPVGERRVVAEATSGDETEVSDGRTRGTASETGREDETTTTTTTALLSAVERHYETARETVARHVAEQIVQNRLSFTQTFELGGEATAGLSGNLQSTIGLGDLVGFIPGIGPELRALLSGLGPEIELTLTPSLQLQVSARSTSTFTGEHSEETRTTDERSVREAVTQAMTNRWETRFETQLQSTIRRRTSDSATASDSHAERRVDRHGSTSRSEGVATTQRDVPRLVLRR